MTATRDRIRRHYDRLAFFYRRWWGIHLHHGYFDEPRASPARAQERLCEVVARAARVAPGDRVLDVGCGFGGSARWLARRYGARVMGWTLSRRQAVTAARSAPRDGRCLFVQTDAETWPARPESFDVVWIVECLEHLTDKPAAIARAGRALRPGGVLALCAWMAAQDGAGGDRVDRVAEAFLCPSLASPAAHARWAQAAGLRVETRRDLTPFVRPTWTHCARRVERPWVRACLPFVDGDTRRFVRGFRAIADAYAEGDLVYGLLVARKPPPRGPRAAGAFPLRNV